MTNVRKTYCVALCLVLLFFRLGAASSILQEDENNRRTVFEEVSESFEGDKETLNSLTEKFSSPGNLQGQDNARDTILEKVMQRLEVAEKKLEVAEQKLGITETEIKELKTTGVKCEDNTVQKNIARRQEYDGTAVGFTACISARDLTHLGSYHTIIFDQVITNIGNAYHPYTGIFIAPFKGLYVFHLTALQSPGLSIYFDIMKSGVRIDDVFVDATGLAAYQSVSEHWVLELDKGQEVWIRTSAAGQIHGFCHTSFSGFLITHLM